EIVGLESGVLSDSRAPLVISFGMPVDPDTLFVKVVIADSDPEGNLFDEDGDPDTELKVLASRDPLEGDRAAKKELVYGDSRSAIRTDEARPGGPELMLVVETCLKAKSCKEAKTRQKIPFSYAVKCGAARPTALTAGVYFMLLDVQEPLGVQIQLYGALD